MLAALVGVGTASALITDTKADEGEVHASYADLGGVWTACSGTTRGIGPNQRFTPEQCEGMTAADLVVAASVVLRCAPALRGHNNQLRAAVRFQNNTGKFCSSTGGRLMAAGQFKAGCNALLAYNGIVTLDRPLRVAIEVRRLSDKGGHKRYFNVIRGLNNRRHDENVICLAGAA